MKSLDRRRLLLLALPSVALLVAACATPPASTSHPLGRGAQVRSASSHQPAPTTTLPPAPTTTLAPPEPGWNPIGSGPGGVAVDQQTVATSDGPVTVTRFRAGQVHFALHVGSGDPPGAASSVGPGAGPSVSAAERPLLLAAFNGGFQASTGAGGMEVQGNVLMPLQAGLASLVIDADGTAHVGIWGQTVPVAGEPVVSVRQNLQPLVEGSQPSGQSGDVGAWGATLGGGASVARSALGEDAQGNLLYAGSMSSIPAAMASALVSAGAVTAMELDINPEWVQLAFSATPGGPLSPGVPGQNRPADQYLQGWTRDFVTVLSAS